MTERASHAKRGKPKRNGNHAATVAGSTLTVESWPIDRVIPYARNPRKNAHAVAKVAASLKEFGWRQPIVLGDA